jgi:biotin transporter BioY
MTVKGLPRVSLAFLQWLLLVVGLGFICAAGWLWLGMVLGLASIGVALIIVAFLSAVGEVKS